MPRRPVESVSNSRADRAGEFFRTVVQRELEAQDYGDEIRIQDADEFASLREAIDVMTKYRGMHEYPLTKVTIGVRQMIATELGERGPRPGQRFKRMPRIIGKLLRFPHMRLSQMEDIGGCRAVFGSLGELRSVEARIRRRWPHAQVTDYTAQPKADGYRAVHIVERRDGRLIEVQLRTTSQHLWAENVEAWSSRLPGDLKDGDGPADLKRYFAMAAERLARGDAGLGPDPPLEEEFATVREGVRHYFEG